MSDTVISIHDTSAGAFAFVFDYVLEMRYVVLGGQCKFLMKINFPKSIESFEGHSGSTKSSHPF